MELDDFKATFNKNTDQPALTDETLTTMLTQQPNGPLASLAKNLKFTLYVFPLVAASFIATSVVHPAARYSPTRWLLLGILFTEFAFAIANTVLVKKLRHPRGSVKANLLRKVALLQKNNRAYLTIHQMLYVLMAVVLEVAMHAKADPLFDGWARVNPVIRVAVYVAFLVMQFFGKRRAQEKYYGRYINNLQVLVKEVGC